MNAGYIKHFTDKYPTLLNEEFRKEVKIHIPPAEVFIKNENPFAQRVLDPDLESCVSGNREELIVAAARYIRTFELHGAQYTSVEGAKLEIDISRLEFIVTNTAENIIQTRELFEEFSAYWYDHRYHPYPISISHEFGDPFAPKTNKSANKTE